MLPRNVGGLPGSILNRYFNSKQDPLLTAPDAQVNFVFGVQGFGGPAKRGFVSSSVC